MQGTSTGGGAWIRAPDEEARQEEHDGQQGGHGGVGHVQAGAEGGHHVGDDCKGGRAGQAGGGVRGLEGSHVRPLCRTDARRAGGWCCHWLQLKCNRPGSACPDRIRQGRALWLVNGAYNVARLLGAFVAALRCQAGGCHCAHGPGLTVVVVNSRQRCCPSATHPLTHSVAEGGHAIKPEVDEAAAKLHAVEGDGGAAQPHHEVERQLVHHFKNEVRHRAVQPVVPLPYIQPALCGYHALVHSCCL